MSSVYVIRNIINGKEYVGKTSRTPNLRWKEHLRDMSRNDFSHRPLYRAMNKYGSENFSFEVLHDNLTEKESEQLEIFEIQSRNTYSKGYNATIGGDGKTYRLISEEDKETIVELYTSGSSILEIAKHFDADTETVSKRLMDMGITIDGKRNAMGKNGLRVEKDSLVIFFETGSDFIEYLIENNLTTSRDRKGIGRSISRAIRGERKTYLGFSISKEL